jgi:TonB-dependent SusC/RagA subfamily outer membrane receptor
VPLVVAEVPQADGVVGDIDSALQEVRLEATRSAAAEAGRVGTRIRVRTGGSLGGLAASDAEDSPLIVVNGEEWTLSGSEVELNPEDIASIEILKGAAAQARYGARAANGVILITLKDGA